METTPTFTPQDIQDLDVELKVGLLGTLNAEGLPHLTMLSSLRPYAPQGLVFGQFTEGLSKQHVLANPKTAFLILSLDKQVWRGTARFSHTAQNGPEYERYNNQPMFRYNAYFGVHTVYYLELVSLLGRRALPMGGIVPAAILTRIARSLGAKDRGAAALNPWTRGLLNKLDNLKFLCALGADGYPRLLPLIQAQALDGGRVLFNPGPYRAELASIPVGAPVALYGMAFSMETVLLRGVYQGVRRVGGLPCGVAAIEWVYNAMPPAPQQIYPPLELAPVEEF